MDQGSALITRFVSRLTEETNSDEAVWHSEVLNIYSCLYKGFRLWTDWEKADRLQLSVDDAFFEGAAYGIQALWEAIGNQFRRQGRYRLSGGTGILPQSPAMPDQEEEVLARIGKFLGNQSR